jgi:hypothetical protein
VKQNEYQLDGKYKFSHQCRHPAMKNAQGLHLIVTCTKRKTAYAGSTVFPEAKDTDSAYEAWKRILAQTSINQTTISAGDLYTGQHWNRAAAAASRTGAELWVISAGLGLLHASDPVVPYDATFSSMPFSHRAMWQQLTSRPLTERRSASLTALMQARPDDRFVIAASPMYLRAIEDDLCSARRALHSPEQLTIVTSQGYRGHLSENVRMTNAGMMKTLNTNMTGLNLSYALQILNKLISEKSNNENH